MTHHPLRITLIFVSALLASFSGRAEVLCILPDSLQLSTPAPAECSLPDSIASIGAEAQDSLPLCGADNPNFWRNRMKSHTFNIADTTIVYPRFMHLCVNVYNWADRVFNTYDHDYVEPTGKKWKVLWRNTNWTDSYALDMPDNVHIRMLSDLFMSMGPTISFMAVSLSYYADVNRLVSGKAAHQKRFDVSFSTALFEIDLYFTNNHEGTYIRRFDPYDQGHLIKTQFPSLQLENYGVFAYYFLNHGRYYHGAAYNYSKIQKRSQGSFIFGLSVSHQFIDFDLSTLPETMRDFLPDGMRTHFRFSYNDFCLLAGYGFNWVFNPHWVFNISGLPSFGLKHCMADNGDGRKNLPAINIAARMGIAYNLKNYFIGAVGAADAHWYLNKDVSFINSVITFGLATGLRF